MQNHSLGIHVFPTKRSDAIRDNPSLLHFGSPHGTVKFKRFEEVSKNLGANCENKQVGQQKSELQQKKVQENAAPNLLKALELPKTLNLSENERKPSNSSKVGQKQTIISDPLALPDVSSKQSRKQDLENSPKSPNESESSFKEKQQAIAGVIHKGSFSQSAGELPLPMPVVYKVLSTHYNHRIRFSENSVSDYPFVYMSIYKGIIPETRRPCDSKFIS